MMLSEELIELANKTIPWTKVQFPSEYDYRYIFAYH